MQTATRPPVVVGLHSKVRDQEPSDGTLIQSIATGDKRAMQILFARHNILVFRFALRLTGNRSLAEDIVSEVFLEVWRQAGAFMAKSRVSTWLLAIARNKAFSTLKRRPLQLEDDYAIAIVDPGDNAEAALNRSNSTAIVGRCLAQLSPAHREVIDLVYYHERSVREVAMIVGIPEGTVKTRMYHARRRTAELLKAAGLRELSEF